MIPKINKQGHSFKGVTKYLMHDKDALTTNRVEWSSTGNLFTNDIEKASLVMSWTDKNAELLKQDSGGSNSGRKVQNGSVYHYSLSWSPDERPSKEHQQEQAHATLEKLGLSNNQYYCVAHNDTDHPHVHIVVNLTNPETGKRTDPHLDKNALQEWALNYEKKHGIFCEQRVKNAELRSNNKTQKHQNHKQDYSEKITQAFISSDSGKAFINALEAEGLLLGKSRRGNSFVVVDEKGDIQKLSRQLDIEQRGKAKTTAINSKLADIDRDDVPDADQLSKEIKTNNNPVLKSVESENDNVEVISKSLINPLITDDINHEHSIGAGDLPIDVLDRLMGEAEIGDAQESPNDDVLDRLMGDIDNDSPQDAILSSKPINKPLSQSNPFNQSNPFIGKTSDLFGQSGGIGEMTDAFKEELESDVSLSDEEKESLFNKLLDDIEEHRNDSNGGLSSEKFEEIKQTVLNQAHSKGR